jgi:hypothetical protein
MEALALIASSVLGTAKGAAENLLGGSKGTLLVLVLVVAGAFGLSQTSISTSDAGSTLMMIAIAGAGIGGVMFDVFKAFSEEYVVFWLVPCRCTCSKSSTLCHRSDKPPGTRDGGENASGSLQRGGSTRADDGKSGVKRDDLLRGGGGGAAGGPPGDKTDEEEHEHMLAEERVQADANDAPSCAARFAHYPVTRMFWLATVALSNGLLFALVITVVVVPWSAPEKTAKNKYGYTVGQLVLSFTIAAVVRATVWVLAYVRTGNTPDPGQMKLVSLGSPPRVNTVVSLAPVERSGFHRGGKAKDARELGRLFQNVADGRLSAYAVDNIIFDRILPPLPPSMSGRSVTFQIKDLAALEKHEWEERKNGAGGESGVQHAQDLLRGGVTEEQCKLWKYRRSHVIVQLWRPEGRVKWNGGTLHAIYHGKHGKQSTTVSDVVFIWDGTTWLGSEKTQSPPTP